MKPVQPAVQPVSMHDTPHAHHGALPLITAMLGVFLVLETVALGYGVVRYIGVSDRVQNGQQAIADKRDEVAAKIDEVKKSYPPLFYAPLSNNGEANRILMIVDRKTGSESVAYVSPEGKHLELVAVPQVGYKGEVYISLSVWESDGGMTLYKLDTLNDNELTLITESGKVTDNYVVSPDQTKIAYVPFDLDVDKYATGNKLKVYDLVTGTTSDIGDSGDAYYWSAISDFSGSGAGYSYVWVDSDCLEASVYARPETDVSGADNTYSATNTVCIGQ
ncbi:MAG: hypothetical protein QG626_25 [Patescibacteria group bacterium]|nr:hypothetical protein [Patescibacteria group bacterium]